MLKKIFGTAHLALIGAVRVALYWNKALDAASKGNHAQALESIAEIEKITPSLTNAQILKVYLLFSVKKYKESISAARISVDLIKKSGKYTEEEKKYLIVYMSIWGNAAATLLGREDETLHEVKMEDIKLDRVRRHLKRKFLLRDHPDWICE